MYFLLLSALTFSVTVNADQIDPAKIDLIVGGTSDIIQNHPHLVSLFNAKGFWCCGSIISERHVLTAAHCVVHSELALFVRAGSSYWTNGGSVHHVEYNITHGNEIEHDLAVLRVTEKFVLDGSRQIIDLFYPKEETMPGTMGTLAGWGSTDVKAYSKQIKTTQIPIVDRAVCNKIYKGMGLGEITSGKICAGFLETGGKDSCQGDSGGPLVIDGRQAGIVSMGHGCGMPHYPGIYTEVSFYNEWIMEQISL